MNLEMLDLRGGNIDRNRVYKAANGVVVTSSANTYSSSNYYYLAYLFNRTYGTSATHYWMTSSSGNQTLTFDLRSVSDFYLKKIVMYPYSRTNASSNYRIEVSSDGVAWEAMTGWVNNHHSSNNANYVAPGQYREHPIHSVFDVRFIRFTLTRNGSYGVALNEIELYGVRTPPPNKIPNVFISRQRYLMGESFIVNWLPTTDPEGRRITYKVDMLVDGVWRNMADTIGNEVAITVPEINTFMDSKIRVIPCNQETCNEPTESSTFTIAPYVLLLKDGSSTSYKTVNAEEAIEEVPTDHVSLIEKGLLTTSGITHDILQELESPKIVFVDYSGRDKSIEVDGIAKIGFSYEANFVEPEASTLIPLTQTYYESRNVVTTIQRVLFNLIPSYRILVQVYLENGLTLSEEATVSIVNTAPTIDASFQENMLNVAITDGEGDLFTYQVRLNGDVIYPVHKEWGDFTSHMEFSKLLNSTHFNIGQQNSIEIVARDHYGETSTKVIDFIGEYIGLMFTDMDGEYYSTELGEVLKYMQIAPMMAGQSSLIYSVKLVNFYNFKVNNVLLWSSSKNIDSVHIQLSKTAAPFEPQYELDFGSLELDKHDEIVFYVRIVSQHSALVGGVFDVFTKAKVVK